MELLQLAHRVGVPCPEPMAELAAVSIDREGSTYHRLAMRRLADDPVPPEDVAAYAASLVGAVLRLHGAGVLHCDVKPRNVLWDAAGRGASLADFGHAQREAGAGACAGTPGYTDPRVGARGGAAQPTVGRVQRRQNDPRGWETRGGRRAFTPDVEGDSYCASRLTLERALEELDRGGAP
jgi:serine/threonine protein kinase